jgi:hypothetical protein
MFSKPHQPTKQPTDANLLLTIVDRIPTDLRNVDQWVPWRRLEREGRWVKAPHTCTGSLADVTNPRHLSSFEKVLRFAIRFGFFLGFVFTLWDPFCGVDLDNIWPSDAAEAALWAMGIIDRFHDTYMEGSPSDKGVKIWCRAQAPRCGRWPVEGGAIEVYDRSRFFALTGRSNRVTVVADHAADIQALVANLDENRRRYHYAQERGIPGVIPQGQRHNTLLSLGGTMFRRGMTLEAIEAALLITDEKQCDPPRGPEHIHKLVASMAKWKR